MIKRTDSQIVGLSSLMVPTSGEWFYTVMVKTTANHKKMLSSLDT